jgi:UDPglucose--hexose-1-phosphate uridylyltransferase
MVEEAPDTKSNHGGLPNIRGVSELRQDMVTGAWVVIASSRGKRPSAFLKHSVNEEKTTADKCPFENPQASGNGDPLLLYGTLDDWRVQVIQNKYPAFLPHGDCIEGGTCKVGCSHQVKQGPYVVRDAYGFHEVLITRDHERYMARLTPAEVAEVVQAYLERFRYLKKQDCVRYISIFENHGSEAGASIYHPHSQIVAVPFLPSDVRRSLRGSRAFNNRHHRCVHCLMIKWEQAEKKRVLFENEHFIAFCPFVSFSGFEVRVFPKEHHAEFDSVPEGRMAQLAEVLQVALQKIDKTFGNAPYNFFVHTAPVQTKRDYSYYHWHLEIIPKLSIDAGFELGTGVQITTIAPEIAASHLNEK